METNSWNFFILYIFLPLIALITGIGIYFLNKRINLFGNKKLIIILISSALILGLPGILGLVDYWFMPYIYLTLSITYFILGIYNLSLINWLFKELQDKSYVYEATFFMVQIILGIGLFSLFFNMCNELKYGIWASTCILSYSFVSLFRQTYHTFINIPLEIYEVWTYSPDKKVDRFNFRDCNEVLKIELFKSVRDSEPHRIIAKSKDSLIFSEWFQYVLEDYNAHEPAGKIECYDTQQPFGWVFYVKPSFFSPRRYIDPKLTILENKINRPYTIMARRARNESQTSNK